MIRIILILFLSFPVALCAQTYQQLSEKAIEYIEMDSLSKAEELLLQALKLEPKNAKNAMLFSNLGLVQRRLGEYDKALESYSFALNFAPLAVPILLDRAAINLEMGNTDRAYTDYCQVLDEDKQNKEALLMRAYIYVLRRDYPRHESIIIACWRLTRKVIAVGLGWLPWNRKKENSRKRSKFLIR